MKRGIFRFLIFFVCVVIISGCTPKARYDRMVKRELASGIRHDSLFMGLYLGMIQKDFYVHCWNLNHQGLVRQGEGNATVEYRMRGELKHSSMMNFYPKFVEGKIYEMPVRFNYTGWAPWNKELSSENLMKDVLGWYKKIYGGGFIEVDHPLKGPAFVKVDGNRRITIFKTDDLYVWAVFTDLLVKKDSANEVIPYDQPSLPFDEK